MDHFYPRPKGTATKRVWDIADELSEQAGTTAARADVIRRYEAEGGNHNTASTQYHHWRKAREATRAGGTAKGPTFLRLQMKEGGRIVIPAEVRTALGIAEGDQLSAMVKDGELTLMSFDTALRRVQALVRKHVPDGVSLVDELIAERRAENARDSL